MLRHGACGVRCVFTVQDAEGGYMQVYDGDQERYAKLSGHGFRILAEAVEKDLPYEIKCPALLICGEQDKAGSCVRYNKAWHKNTGIPLEWIKDAGHMAKGGLLMNGTEARICETWRSQARLPLRQAWIDRDGKLISFHPIDSGQLLEDEEATFWENVISLPHIGYRIQ